MPKIEEYVAQNFGSVENFLENNKYTNVPKELARSIKIIEKKKEFVKFFSLFDFSVMQFENIKDIVNKVGLETVKRNPYILLENYYYDLRDSWDIEETDYGLGLYQIDIALIPDPKYADWESLYEPQSPERLRAVVTKILYDAANQEGSSYLTREEIVKCIEEYPLYYISGKLKIDVHELLEFEKQAIFKEKFFISRDIYQLNEIRKIENLIEQFIDKMLKKTYNVDIRDVEAIVRKEKELFKEKLFVDERKRLYTSSLSNGLFVLTGKAGSGKTHAIVNLVPKFKDDGKLPIYVFTPTGKANLVIRSRLKKLNLHEEAKIRVSTIHRFLYSGLMDYIKYTYKRDEISRVIDLISKILSGKWGLLQDLINLMEQGWKFSPKVVIIDEASMVDEVLLAILFSIINLNTLEHLILVGDEKQLPPIGVGRPLVDLTFYLRKRGLETNIIHLQSNLRFNPSKRLGMLSELFGSEEQPSLREIEECLKQPDDSLETRYFADTKDLKKYNARNYMRSREHK